MSQVPVEVSKLKKDIEKSFKKGNIQNAIELCQSALLKHPTDADLHVKLGDLYMEWHLDIYQARQYIDEAITEYQRALESNINPALAHYKIAFAFYLKGEMDKALNQINISLKLIYLH